jgi:formylglycine-generating enzyme required for sulfatase activity
MESRSIKRRAVKMRLKPYLVLSVSFIFLIITARNVSPTAAQQSPEKSNVKIYLPVVFSRTSEMVPVPGGRFQMGCDPSKAGYEYSCQSREIPLHTVFTGSTSTR